MSESSQERVVARRDVYRGRILTLHVDDVILPNGRQTTREIVEHPGAVVIVAVDDQDRVAMVRQYRAAVQRELLELPAGTREPNESAEVCARRELREETGLAAKRWAPLIGFYSAPGFCTEYLSVFIATGLETASGRPAEDESIKREWLDLKVVPGLVAAGEICDAKTIAGLLAFLLRPKTGE